MPDEKDTPRQVLTQDSFFGIATAFRTQQDCAELDTRNESRYAKGVRTEAKAGPDADG